MHPVTTRFVFVLAIACLWLGSAAAGAQVDRSSELQKSVEDFSYQLNLVQQFDRHAAEGRSQLLQQALAAWNASARGDAEFVVMELWLKEAVRASLPGATGPMPPLPRFARYVEIARASRAEPIELSLPARRVASAPRAVTDSHTTDPNRTPELVAAAVPPPANVSRRRAPSPNLFLPREGFPEDVGNPFVDDPPTRQPHVAMRPAAIQSVSAGHVAAKAGLSEPEMVRVNVAELGARIRGLVQGLRDVEAKLLAAPHMPVAELLLTTRELGQLASQREFLSLYLQGLSEAESSRTPELPSLQEAKAMIEARIAEMNQAEQVDRPFDELFSSGEDNAEDRGAIERIEETLGQM